MDDFHISDKHNIYVVISLIIFFIIPFIWVGRKKEILKKFSFKNLLLVLNKSFYYQIIVCIIGLLITFLMQKRFYISQDGFDLLFVEVVFSFALILILYSPIVGILNVFRLLKWRNT